MRVVLQEAQILELKMLDNQRCQEDNLSTQDYPAKWILLDNQMQIQ